MLLHRFLQLSVVVFPFPRTTRFFTTFRCHFPVPSNYAFFCYSSVGCDCKSESIHSYSLMAAWLSG